MVVLERMRMLLLSPTLRRVDLMSVSQLRRSHVVGLWPGLQAELVAWAKNHHLPRRKGLARNFDGTACYIHTPILMFVRQWNARVWGKNCIRIKHL